MWEVIISLTLAPFQGTLEPSQTNIRQWLDNLYSKFQPVEQCRWNQSNIDTLFYAGEQSFVNRYFNYNPSLNFQQYYFNIIQQPVNMITGYQRQNRKSINYFPNEGGDSNTTDQYTRLITDIRHTEGLDEQYSKSCELAAVAGLNLMQPYLDYTEDDPLQGTLKLKIWESNSFLVDPYFRNPNMSDANWIWCQEYITQEVAQTRFPGKVNNISPMSSSPQRYGNFYFLPENYNMNRNDLMVVSYVWYKWKKKRKRLYSKKRNQFFDFAGGDGQLEQILYNIDDMQTVTVESPCWKLCVVLNDQLMYQGENPLWQGSECPFVPQFWNYDPHINQPELRSRSLIYTMRAPQFLMNYKIISNNDIAAATINAGWKRKIGAVANEDNLKKSGQGYDIIINDGYEMTDIEKIIPSAVPESDLALANQMMEMIFATSGINMENWSGQQDKQISSLTMMMKQAANLMVFQKYFDQWDYSLKLLGNLYLQIVLNNWNAEKIGFLIGEEPSPHFYSKVFAKYKVVIEPGLNTPTQKNLQAQQMFEINERFGREVIPASMIIKDMNLQGKTEIVQFLKQQEQQQSQMQQEQQKVAHAYQNAELQELITKATLNIANARERHGRAESNVGLFEERLSMISKNRSQSVKEKMEALTKLLEAIQKFGELETFLKSNQLQSLEYQQENKEDEEKIDARMSTESAKFLNELMGGMMQQNQNGMQQDDMQQDDMQQQMPAMMQ